MKLNREDLDYVTDTSEAVLRGVPTSAHLILWGGIIFFIILIMWANFAVLDEVTSGEGKVIPSSEIQTVQNLEGGIVKEIHAHVGQIVNKNEVIMVIDDTRFASSFRETEVNRRSIQAKIARLEAEVAGVVPSFARDLVQNFPEVVNEERELYQSRTKTMKAKLDILINELTQKEQELAELKSRQEQLQRSYDLVNRELNLTRPLVKTGAVSEVELLRLERQVNELDGEITSNKLAQPRAQAGIDGAKNKVEELTLGMKSEVLAELKEARDEQKRLNESKTALEDRVERTSVRSPVRGTVNKLYINTIGGIVQPGEDLIDIVPLDDSLLIEAQVRPQDIGFLRPGLEATVKLSAYDFSIYGGLKGKVEHISADTITDEQGESFYNIRVRTESSYLGEDDQPLAIIPGMRATVDILTGQKTVLDYLLKPILKTKQKALRER